MCHEVAWGARAGGRDGMSVGPRASKEEFLKYKPLSQHTGTTKTRTLAKEFYQHKPENAKEETKTYGRYALRHYLVAFLGLLLTPPH